MHHQEKRSEQRIQIWRPARLLQGDAHVPIEMINASCAGVFMRMPCTPRVGSLVRLGIDIPTGTLRVWAEVVRVADDRPAWSGAGMRFVALRGEDRRAWEAFIVERARAIYARAS